MNQKSICKGGTAADTNYVELVYSGSLPLRTKEELCCRGAYKLASVLVFFLYSWVYSLH